MNKVFTERERQVHRYEMARRKDTPLAELPNGRVVYESDLDLNRHEQVRLVTGYVIATLVCLAFVLLMGLAGQ